MFSGAPRQLISRIDKRWELRSDEIDKRHKTPLTGNGFYVEMIQRLVNPFSVLRRGQQGGFLELLEPHLAKACRWGNTFCCRSVQSEMERDDHRAGGLFFDSSVVSTGGLCHVMLSTVNFGVLICDFTMITMNHIVYCIWFSLLPPCLFHVFPNKKDVIQTLKRPYNPLLTTQKVTPVIPWARLYQFHNVTRQIYIVRYLHHWCKGKVEKLW